MMHISGGISMKKADGVNKNGDQPVRCNCCGKVLKVEKGILMEDAFEASKEWGYFSKRDMEVHQFNLCEECYETMISQFKIPVHIKKKLEAL
jgi:ribosomal-protein-alanine N-acetyltransferase